MGDRNQDGTGNFIGVDETANPDRYDRHRSIDAHLPPIGAAEMSSASWVMNNIMTDLAWAPSWNPKEADMVLK